eukprot:755853-Hanusia_phi.AAC.2
MVLRRARRGTFQFRQRRRTGLGAKGKDAEDPHVPVFRALQRMIPLAIVMSHRRSVFSCASCRFRREGCR